MIVAAFTKADPANLQPFLLTNGETGSGLGGMFNAAAVCFGVTYLGYDALTNAAEEARVTTAGLQLLAPGVAGRLLARMHLRPSYTPAII